MDKFLIKRKPEESAEESSSKKQFLKVDLKNLPADPGKRPKISEYHPNDWDEIRRAYLQKGPCQLREHNFPRNSFGKAMRRFNPGWFDEFGNWLEYSVSKNAAFCLCCYLMRPDFGEQGGGDTFITNGFVNWKKKEKLYEHIGDHNSAHNQAWRKCEALMKQKQHIEVVLTQQSDQMKYDYRIHLTAIVDCIRFLLRQGLAFRENDESEFSSNKGNFLELLHFLAAHNDIIDKILKKTRGNLKLIAPDIQKDIMSAAAIETTNVIINDVGDDLFGILVDESRDMSVKEQMAVVLRYVNKEGCIIERFLGIVHVSSITAQSLKEALESLLAKFGLSFSRIRGQGYDGASNMQGEFNGLKTLILKDYECSYYVHCFAHQLQLALVAVAKKHVEVTLFFSTIANLLNVVGSSSKQRDLLREIHIKKVIEALESGEISSGCGLNQETNLIKAEDT